MEKQLETGPACVIVESEPRRRDAIVWALRESPEQSIRAYEDLEELRDSEDAHERPDVVVFGPGASESEREALRALWPDVCQGIVAWPLSTWRLRLEVARIRSGGDQDPHLAGLVESLASEHSEAAHLITHDVRGPMSILQSALGFLARSEGRDTQELVETCQDAVSSVLVMLKNVDYLAFDGAAIDAEGTTDLEPLAREAVERLAPAFPLREISLEAQIEADTCEVTGNPPSFQLLLDNLLRYASEGAPMGSVVQFVLRKEDGHAVLETRDKGPTSNVSIGDLVYSPSCVSDLRTNGVRTGRCSGLSVLCLIAAQAGGRVSVESAEDGSHVVSVSLPLKSS